MNISEKLSEKQLKDILINNYDKGLEDNNVNVIELIEEIKKQIIISINSSV